MPAPSLQPGQFNTNLRFAVEKEGGFEALGLTPAVFMSLFPVGAVMMWADEETIPDGWEIIADAEGRYIIGLGSGDTGLATGGSATHTHPDHSFTDPGVAVNATNTLVSFKEGTGAAQLLPTGAHLHDAEAGGGAVGAHTAANNDPLSIGVFLIKKVA